MKKAIGGWSLLVLILAACNKNQMNPASPEQVSFIGMWNVDTVTAYFYDSSGLREMGVHVYPADAPDYPFHFQFNDDYSWSESLHLPTDSDYVAATGMYTITSDSAFTLMYNNAATTREMEPCKILSLTDTTFVFSKELSTVFNGNDSGYIRYVYQLTKL
jgi:hypothetical protein